MRVGVCECVYFAPCDRGFTFSTKESVQHAKATTHFHTIMEDELHLPFFLSLSEPSSLSDKIKTEAVCFPSVFRKCTVNWCVLIAASKVYIFSICVGLCCC